MAHSGMSDQSPSQSHNMKISIPGLKVQPDDISRRNHDDGKIPLSSLLQILQGVAVATKSSDEDIRLIDQCLTSHLIPVDFSELAPRDDKLEFATLSFQGWLTAVEAKLQPGRPQQLANLAICVAFLREKCRQTQSATVSTADLALVWNLIHSALTSPLLPPFTASRSAQGFLAVPICSLVNEGNIDELFRLHVWLPDGQRGNRDFAIHSHQTFVQSWILAGEGKNKSYVVEPESSPTRATHAEYALAWNDGKTLSNAYKTHQAYSTVVNTKAFVRATPIDTSIHTRDMTYSIPAAAFHSTEVAPDTLHATIFFFDSHRGFAKDAPVLGPENAHSFTQLRDPAGVTPAALANMVEAVRCWQSFMGQGQQHAQRAEWEHALRSFNSALNLSGPAGNLPNEARYRYLVLAELGKTNRRFGRYEQARDILEGALAEMGPSLQRIEFSGELGVVYRHMNRLEDAKRAFEIQYDTAKRLNFERVMCRTVGNLGMVNYQLSQQNHNSELLDLAIAQLNERVQIARRIKDVLVGQSINANNRDLWIKDATTWESIGLARLSLCYAASGNAKDAIKVALESLNITNSSEDSTVIAMSRFFYGRALLMGGEREEAIKQFNPSTGCTPAIALCKEPSDEHFQYLRELVEAGADMDLIDEQGYTALDYAVFSGDKSTQTLVLRGLRGSLDGDVEEKILQRQTEAKLRKGYRELFQEKMRPMLLSGSSSSDGLQRLRRVYADSLAADEEKRSMFDGLKFLMYSDFLRFGKLPRSSDGLARQYVPESVSSHQVHEPEFVIFFSYRWINKDPAALTPDDANHTQYRRMVEATQEFLILHPSVDQDRLRLWVDHACVDQDDPMLGVSALPMIVAQCNAVISLVDDKYYSRAWCSVEVMMAQRLRKSYNVHLWYEHVPASPNSQTDKKWSLRDGPMDLKIVMAEKNLSFEKDRPKVLFLERQSKLLG